MRTAIIAGAALLVATTPAASALTPDGKRYTIHYDKANAVQAKGLPAPGKGRIAGLSKARQKRVWNLLRYRVWPSQFEAMKRRKAARALRWKFSAPPGWAESHRDVSACESGNRPHINTGNGFYGKWQFHPGTWRGFTAWAARWPYAHQAPEYAQDGAAYRLWLNSGMRFGGHWPVCGAGQ